MQSKQSKIILIHHHIFKNAGTSFNHSLKQFFQDSFAEYDLPNSQIVTEDCLALFIANHPKISAISSHHACMPSFSRDGYQTISSVLLRNPLARVESIYNFERKQIAQNKGALKAKQLDFKEYVSWRLQATPVMLCNYQTHYCSRSKSSDIGKIPTLIDLEKAICNLHKCAVVGTVERYQDTLKVSAHILQRLYPQITLEHYRLNTTLNDVFSEQQIRERLIGKIGQDLVNSLEINNQLDRELYKAADKIIDANLRKATTKF